MPLRAALYARISIDDKKTPAIKNQLSTLRALAAAEGYSVVAELYDEGISAYRGKLRPGFVELLKGVNAKAFDVVLAVAEDRFTRSSEEKFGFMSYCVK